MIDSNTADKHLNNSMVSESLKSSYSKNFMDVVENNQALNNQADYENCQTQEKEEDNDNVSTVGYISVKDFAYDESNPLHYGYFDDGQDFVEEYTSINNNSINCNNNNQTFNDDIATTEVTDTYNIDDEYDDDFSQRPQSLMIPDDYIINKKAVALYDFQPENTNELELKEGDIIFVNYRHGQGWLVAENLSKTKNGFVPEEYVSFLDSNQSDDDNQVESYHNTTDNDKYTEDKPRPFYLTEIISKNLRPNETDDQDSVNNNVNYHVNQSADEWEDIESDFDEKLTISEEK